MRCLLSNIGGKNNYSILIIADHGNSDVMINSDGTAGAITNVISHSNVHPYSITLLDDDDTISIRLNTFF